MTLALSDEPIDPLYVAARRVLLDALVALEAHRSAVVIVGAQAVYLRTGESGLAVAPYTTDADLTLDPSGLVDDPTLSSAMRNMGFEHQLIDGHIEPGIWVATVKVEGRDEAVPVDLIVPSGMASSVGRRSVRLGPHGRRAARHARGLEAALVDHSVMEIGALDGSDRRRIQTKVAGEAALLIAKAHKLHDRAEAGRDGRLHDKDASDVVRLMQATIPSDVGATLRHLMAHPEAGGVAQNGLGFLVDLFGRRGRPGIQMAARALEMAMPAATVETLCVAYMDQLRRTAEEV